MMIKTISDYLYQIQHERPYIELQMARRRAFRLICLIFIVLTIGIIAWVLSSEPPSYNGPGRSHNDPGSRAPVRKGF